MTTPTLHLLCGKIASGKSTLATQLGTQPATIVIREDDWLAALYCDEMKSVADYVRFSARLRDVIGPHVVALLTAGMSVVLDFPANTLQTRRWMRQLFLEANSAHKLHYLDVQEDLCKARLYQRNLNGDHAFQVSDEQFLRISKHFEPPTAQEGFDIEVHGVTKG